MYSMSPIVGIGTLSPPLLEASVPLSPGTRGGEGGAHCMPARGWVSPNSDDWRKSLALCLLSGFSDSDPD